MEQAVAGSVQYFNNQQGDSVFRSTLDNSTSNACPAFGMQEIVYELQENIVQTAACVKMLLNSLADHSALPDDKLELMNIYMKVLIHDIRSLATRITQNSPM